MKESEPIRRRLFNICEVAAYMGLSVHTLYTMVNQRECRGGVPMPQPK